MNPGTGNRGSALPQGQSITMGSGQNGNNGGVPNGSKIGGCCK